MNGLYVFGICLLVAHVASDDGGVIKRLDEKTADEMTAVVQKQCKEESNVDAGVYARALKSNMDVDDSNLKCYTKCIMNKFRIMKEDGTYDLNIMLATLPESRAKLYHGVAKVCNNENHPDACQRAMDVYKCTQKELKHLFKFF